MPQRVKMVNIYESARCPMLGDLPRPPPHSLPYGVAAALKCMPVAIHSSDSEFTSAEDLLMVIF